MTSRQPIAPSTIEAVLAGDRAAWTYFAQLVAPRVEALASRSRHMGYLRTSIDDRRTILADVLERLYASDFRALRGLGGWLDRNPIKTFDDWLAILTTNIIRDHVRSRLGGRPRAKDGRSPVNKRLANTLASRLEPDSDRAALDPAMTAKLTTRELLEFARVNLPSEQLEALEPWLGGASFEEIASALGLAGPKEAEKRVRAALARLRRYVDE